MIETWDEQLNKPCDCGLTPKHVRGEHDNCCQICGGNHTERLCPNNNCPLKEPCSHFGECTHTNYKECRLYVKIIADKKGKKWAKDLSWAKGIKEMKKETDRLKRIFRW